MTRRPLMIPSLLALGICLTANGTALAQQDDPDDLATDALAVLRRHCQGCHNGPGSSNPEFAATDIAGMTDYGVLVPGDAEASDIYDYPKSGFMPPRSIRERPTDDEIEAIRAWIEAGAPAFPEAESRDFLPLETVLEAVRDDLDDVDRDDRPFLRYFTLVEVYNDPSLSDEDLRYHRAALSKAINSMSWAPRVVRPRAVDENEVVFAIDLRDYEWDRADVWRILQQAYPYGLEVRTGARDDLNELQEEIAAMTGEPLAMLRADWFVATATRPPLYHEIVYDTVLPDLIARRDVDDPANRKAMTAKDLERFLGIDIRAAFERPRPERIARGAVTDSGVSNQNRMLERLESKFGAYWKSYDFEPLAGLAKLNRFPLGPLNLFPDGEHPFAFQAFIHAGGEIIYNLPNGLQGYLLVDGEDRRIDEGPIPIVSDDQRISGTPAIVNGLSCMACHSQGMIAFRDEVRDNSAISGRPEEFMRRLYPKHEVMDDLIDRDRQRFRQANDQAIGVYFEAGDDEDDKATPILEPIGYVAERYRTRFLDLRSVAAELHFADPDQLIADVGRRRIRQLGLEVLLTEGGKVSRNEWEAVNGLDSLMQELARSTAIYTPLLVR